MKNNLNDIITDAEKRSCVPRPSPALIELNPCPELFSKTNYRDNEGNGFWGEEIGRFQIKEQNGKQEYRRALISLATKNHLFAQVRNQGELLGFYRESPNNEQVIFVQYDPTTFQAPKPSWL